MQKRTHLLLPKKVTGGKGKGKDLIQEGPSPIDAPEQCDETMISCSTNTQNPLCTSGCGPAFGITLGSVTLENHRVGPDGDLGIPFTAKGNLITGARFHHQYISTFYYGGDGGTVKYKIYPDLNGAPDRSSAPLAETNDIIGASSAPVFNSLADAQAAYPNADLLPYGELGNASRFFRRFDFIEPYATVPCEHYWMVVCNTSDDPLTDFISINMSQTKGDQLEDYCHTHPQSMNHQNLSDYYPNQPDEWTLRGSLVGSGTVGNWEIYGDQVYGQAFAGDSRSGQMPTIFSDTYRSHGLDADWQLRECVVPDKDMQICRLNLFASRVPGATDPITAVVKDASGNTLASGVFPDFIETPYITSPDNSLKDQEWQSVDIPPTSLTAGQTYYFEFSSADQHVLKLMRDGPEFYFESTLNCSGFPQGYAQQSSDGGVTWVDADNSGTNNRLNDIQFYMNIYADGVNSCLEDCCDCPVS